ncbi:MAG: 2-hydroxychromene-2-carboxylate isomerase [Myxococcota bacterium]|nr:2-hydroxychromene-2-carboxylate isomerase [Myxococcota bacterium]
MTVFYFDFLSPYSYIASQLIQARYQELDLDYRPVVLGSILSKRGVAGPGEIPERRRIGLEDALLLAQHYGFNFEGPPTHPFNSIYALRSVCAVEDKSLRKALVHRYFSLAWEEGKSLEDLGHLRACLKELGIEHDPEEVATSRQYRSMLKSNTKEALGLGVWGVPSFTVDNLVFFGHDRLSLLQAYLSGKIQKQPEKLSELLNRPQPGRIK